MLTTEMWPIERLSHLHTNESSHQLSDDDLHLSSNDPRPFRTCSRPEFNKNLNSYWRDDDDDYQRNCSMPSYVRCNPDIDQTRYDDQYYDVSMATKRLHHPQSNRSHEYGVTGHRFDVSNRSVDDNAEGSKPVDGSRGRIDGLYGNKSMNKTDDFYPGDDAYVKRNELSQPGDIQGQSSDRVHHLRAHHPKGHPRDFSESRASTPHVSFGYNIKNATKPRCPTPHPERSYMKYKGHEGHNMDPRANPRRFASAMDDNPIMVHQYKKSQTCTQSRNETNDNQFPTATNSDHFVVIDDDDDDDSGGGGDDDDDETKKYHNLRPFRRESLRLKKKEIDVAHQSSDNFARFTSQRFSNEANKEPSTLTSHLNDSTSEKGGTSVHPTNNSSAHPTNDSSAHPTNESSTDVTIESSLPSTDVTKTLSQKVVLARSHVPKKHSSKDLCVICGDKASGYHYNTLSCEGCKGFFRRTITRSLHYQCKYGGNCVMDTWMRRKCPACRLKRCKQVGMREECLLTEHQCVIRNSRRRLKIKMKKEEESDHQPSKDASIGGSDMSADDTQAILASLNSDHRDLIERLVNLQDKYEIPSPDDLKLLREDKMYNASSQDDLSDAIFVHMVEMTILVTRLIVEFAKHLPGFRNLLKEDQIVLLKSSSSEVMMLRTARRYNADTNTIVFGNGVPFSPSSMAFGGLQESVESLFNFSKSMSCLYVDNAEYALLTAMCIFSIRSGLTNPSVVDKLQEVYMEVLLAYISKRRSRCQNYLAKLLMKFVNLRTLGHEHSQTLYNLTLKKGSLPPLLTEYFDISE